MPLTSIRLSGYQICDYYWVLNRQFTSEETSNISDINYEPNWSLDTEFLATFFETLRAGSLSSGDSAATAWRVYRQEVGTSTYVLAATMDSTTQSIVDYNVKNNTQYIYRLYAETTDYITAPLVSDPISTDWLTWCLFDVVPSDDNESFVLNQAFTFAIDINSGGMSNNIQSSTFNNFTPYPKVQVSSNNHYSGTLQSMLGNIDCTTNVYDEGGLTKENALKLFTTNGNRKFLKDIRGHIWEVSITSFTVTPRDQYPNLPYDVQIGWVEIGSADGLQLIGYGE